MNEIIFTEKAPLPVGPYSQAVLKNGTLYCSGQIAVGLLDADVATQTKRVCENITALLQAGGMQVEDVVKTTCFLANMEDFETFNGVYAVFFPHKPARSCVAAKGLPKGALVEIEVLAVK